MEKLKKAQRALGIREISNIQAGDFDFLKEFTDEELDDLLEATILDSKKEHEEEGILLVIKILNEFENRHPEQFKVTEEELKRAYEKFRDRLFREDGVRLPEYKQNSN